MVPAVGALLALSAALAAACFVKAYGVSFLGRPRSGPAASAQEVDRFSLAAMLALAGLCLAAGVLPGFVIDGLSPVATLLTGDHMPVQSAVSWLSIVPIGASRSSYNGLLVFVFIVLSAGIGVFAIHRFASPRVRRAPAWDCGFPDSSPATQYSAASFAQPIRRVYATSLFGARETVRMPAPGDMAPAVFHLTLRDYIWEALYLPVAGFVGSTASILNRFQFLTVRQYLSLVFAALVALLVVLAVWT